MNTGDGAKVRTLRLDLEFDGEAFFGWQRQARGRTVQEVVETALSTLLREPVRVVGAGRTDAGAHARHMVASTRVRSDAPLGRIVRGLMGLLPEDVAVLDLREVDPAFHARRDARWKWYRYSVLRRRGGRPLLRRTTWAWWGPLDSGALDAMAGRLRGRHDFASFENRGSPRRSTVRTLKAVRWTREEELLHLDIVGDGFLYKMVRTLVGTMVQVARAPLDHDAANRLETILDARDRTAAGPAAPAHGLCLRAVGFDVGDAERRLPPFLLRDLETARSNTSGGRS